jgi:hypothetical protein
MGRDHLQHSATIERRNNAGIGGEGFLSFFFSHELQRQAFAFAYVKTSKCVKRLAE